MMAKYTFIDGLAILSNLVVVFVFGYFNHFCQLNIVLLYIIRFRIIQLI